MRERERPLEIGSWTGQFCNTRVATGSIRLEFAPFTVCCNLSIRSLSSHSFPSIPSCSRYSTPYDPAFSRSLPLGFPFAFPSFFTRCTSLSSFSHPERLSHHPTPCFSLGCRSGYLRRSAGIVRARPVPLCRIQRTLQGDKRQSGPMG